MIGSDALVVQVIVFPLALSLSLIRIVAEDAEPIEYALCDTSVIVTVSTLSTIGSSIGFTVTFTDDEPAGMVTGELIVL